MQVNQMFLQRNNLKTKKHNKMKKMFLGLFLLSSMMVLGQDVKKAKKFLEKNELDKAQQAIDEAVTKDAAKAENYLWKHKIYYAIATSDQFKKLVPDAREIGWEAIKKYVSLDKNMTALLVEDQQNYLANFNKYYTDYVNMGSTNLNGNNFADAFKYFKNAYNIAGFFYSQKWTTNQLDTTITFYTGYAAMKGEMKEDAELYYKKMVDANAFGTDYQIAYGWLANYYIVDKKDSKKGLEYAEKGLKLYPNDEYLASQKAAAIGSTGDYKAIFANHEANIAKPTATYNEYLKYAVDLYDYLYADSLPKADVAEKDAKFETIMGKALSMKPSSAECNYLMGFHHANKAIALNKLIKTYKNKKTPADLEAKKKLEEQLNVQIDASLKNHDLAASIYKSRLANIKQKDKDNYISTLTSLIQFYKFKANADRVKSYEEDLKVIKP
jgi:hypothetical protein